MKIHIRNKNYPNGSVSLCNSKSLLLEFAKNKSEVTCKACKAIWEIDRGIIEDFPYGGNMNKEGEPRENNGGYYYRNGERRSAV